MIPSLPATNRVVGEKRETYRCVSEHMTFLYRDFRCSSSKARAVEREFRKFHGGTGSQMCTVLPRNNSCIQSNGAC